MRQDVSADEIRGYLLGQSPEGANESLEQRYFADPDFLAQIELGEADLVDDYITGRLTAEDRERFEQHYLATPQHREEVAVARSLRAASGAAAPQSRAGGVAADAARRRDSTFRWAAVAAVAVLTIGVGVALRVDRYPFSGGNADPPPAAASRPATGGATAAPRTSVVVLRLSTDATRSEGRPPSLAVPSEATHVELQFLAEPAIQRRSAELASVDGGVTWRGVVLPTTDGTVGVNARVLIERSALARGDYVLTVSPEARDATPERYYFRILP